jgi:hypothetical protein
MNLSPYYAHILDNVEKLPDSAPIPLPVAELLAGVCRRTIKRNYPLVQLSPNRQGVLLGHLRRKQETVTA